MNNFEINYLGHERNARRLLLNNNLATIEELATMTSNDVEEKINQNYIAYQNGENWLLIQKEKESEFNEITKWINR